jgi:hypothetical protein
MAQIFIKKLANYKLIVNSGREKTKCISFYSKRNLNSVIKLVSDTICSNTIHIEKNVRILFQKIGHGTKTRHYKVDADTDVFALIKDSIRNDGVSVDVKDTRFTLRIRNNISQETDTKDISFNDGKEFEDLFSFIKFLANEIEQQSKKQMLYISDKPIKSSHTIILMRTGNKQRLLQASKSFSINIPYFSSQEIAEMFQGEQR